MRTRILLADDQSLLRSTFRLLIDAEDDLAVIAEAANGQEAVALARTHTPDVIVMDIRMPVMDGLQATEQICGDHALADTRVLILTTFEIDDYVARAIRAGASGFLGKDVSADGLLSAIRTVATGESLLSPAALKSLISRFLAAPDIGPPRTTDRLSQLTGREREITALVAHGLTNDEIAAHLTISPLTARTHVQRSMTKLGARDRAQLVVIAYQDGLVGQ